MKRLHKKSWKLISESGFGTCYYKVPGLIGKVRIGNHPAGYSHEGGPAANGSITLSPDASATERQAAYAKAETMLREARDGSELVEIIFWTPPTDAELEQEKREAEYFESARNANRNREYDNLKAKYPDASNAEIKRAIKARRKGQNWERHLIS